VFADRFREVLSLFRDAVRADVQWFVGDETTLARCLLSAWMWDQTNVSVLINESKSTGPTESYVKTEEMDAFEIS
jgi:hypothetical protein